MKKMLKIMAMLLVIATVIFAAGCADKETPATEEENTEQVSEETSPASGISEEQTGADEAPNMTENNTTDENITDENITVENITVENITVENSTNETK